MVFQQTQGNYSVVSTNLHVWLNALDLAAKDVIAELRKSRRRHSGATVLQIILKTVHYVCSTAVAVSVVKRDANKCAPSCAEGTV